MLSIVSQCDRPRIVLASTSRYRRELLGRLQVPFDQEAPGVDETRLAGETPLELAMRLAQAKAAAVAARHPGAVVIGSDQVAALDDEAIGKPGDHANAVAQLRRMRGRSVVFHTAVVLHDTRNGRVQSENVPTTVSFRTLPDAALDAYLHAEQPYDCTGSAKSEGLGIALLDRIESDDPTALIGLPLIALTGMLLAAGYPLLAP